jgi:hypothetical protein
VHFNKDGSARRRRAVGLLFLLVLLGHSIQADQRAFGGSFEELRPEQQRLVIDTVSRFNTATGQSLDPQSVYDGARISIRSTFEAVTQALSTTKLTARSGEQRGNALELIDVVEDVAGEVPGARGDLQFRIYAVMKPGAIATLEDSNEFFRDKDNRRYHKGFPVCFRMPGIPSIQVSLTRDGTRADIDVDYRSPKFPQALVNGHLRASNSDVRAGNNGDTHNRRWSGLSQWWKMLFGFDFGQEAGKSEPETVAGIPSSPRTTSKQSLDTAVHDFLSAWLLEAQPRFAVPYFSRRSYACFEAISESQGNPLPAGVARYEILNSMARYAQAIGPVQKLGDVVGPVKLWDSAFQPYKNRYDSEFTIFAIPTDVAESEECSGGPVENKASNTKQKYGEYFGSAFRMRDRNLNEGTLYLVWTRQYGKWQIVDVRYRELDAPGLSASKDVKLPEEKVELAEVPGDLQANQAVHDFLAAWLLRGDFKSASSFVSPIAYACFDPPLEPAQGKQALISALSEVRKTLGPRAALTNYMEPFVPEDSSFRLVTHREQDAFAILSLPRSAAEGFLCGKEQKPADASAPDQTYGRYYVASFRMRVLDGEPAALYTLWTQQEHGWKIVAWQLIAP